MIPLLLAIMILLKHSITFTSVAINISSELPHTDIDFKDFLQDYNITDTFFLPHLTPSAIKEITL